MCVQRQRRTAAVNVAHKSGCFCLLQAVESALYYTKTHSMTIRHLSSTFNRKSDRTTNLSDHIEEIKLCIFPFSVLCDLQAQLQL